MDDARGLSSDGAAVKKNGSSFVRIVEWTKCMGIDAMFKEIHFCSEKDSQNRSKDRKLKEIHKGDEAKLINISPFSWLLPPEHRCP